MPLPQRTPSQSYSATVADFLDIHFSRLTCRRISTMVRPTAGETGHRASAEGATAPETLRQTDRSQHKNSGKQAWWPLRRSNRRSAGKSLRARTEGARIFRHSAEPCRVAFEPEWCPWPKPVPKTSSRPRFSSAIRPPGAASCPLAAMRSPCNIPPASWPSTNGPANRRACSMSAIWGRAFFRSMRPAATPKPTTPPFPPFSNR